LISLGAGVGGSGFGFGADCFSWRVTISLACLTQSTQMLPSTPGITATSSDDLPQKEQTSDSDFLFLIFSPELRR
jgi:hypothetical protein